MRNIATQFDVKTWPLVSGPIVVSAHIKINLSNFDSRAAGNRDGPLIFHMRDGPPKVTGPPGGTGPPGFTSGSGPPKTTGPPMEWLARKKTLKKS